jgi:hypothetical protein
MKESDWKVFKQIKEIAIEKFCTQALNETQEVIMNEQEHIHNRYLLVFKLLEIRNKHMAILFDGHSRSKAWLQLMAMRKDDLVSSDLIDRLSDDCRKQTDPAKLI